MSGAWFENKPDLMSKLEQDIREQYPFLRSRIEAGVFHLRGSFPVEHEGATLDRFQIELRFPTDYPKSLPTVSEIGGRIPRSKDRHVNVDGTACVCVEEEWLLSLGRRPTLRDFIDGPVREFFIGQSLVEKGHPWPFGQRGHGKPGLLEVYGDWFGTQDEGAIRKYLDYLSQKEARGHWKCPCGSGRPLRDCHREALKTLRARIPRALARSALSRLQKVDAVSRSPVAI